MMRRIALFAAALVLSGAALAQQGFPNRPLRMVIPWPPGQATDLVGLEIDYRASEAFVQDLKEQQMRFTEIIKTGGIKIDRIPVA